MPQTTVQDPKQIRQGQGMIEVGDDVGSLVNLGAVDNVKFQETFETVDIISQSTGLIEVRKRNHRCRLTFDQIEINLFNLETIRGDVDTYDTVAADPVENHPYVVGIGDWGYDEFIELDYQNGDASKITPDSVAGSVDGALVLDTDYFIVQDAAGKWGIVVLDSVTVTTLVQTITITYDYTPAANRYLSTGSESVVIAPKVVRITSTDVDGNDLTILIYKARNADGINLEFPPYDSGEPWKCPIVLEGRRDTSRSAKDMLFKITDEQGA